MASPGSHESSEPQSEERRSVLAELPRTRPQRASPRRETARRRARADGSQGRGEPSQAAAADTKPAGKTSGATKTARTAKAAGTAKTARAKAADAGRPTAGKPSGDARTKRAGDAATKRSAAVSTKRSPAAKARQRGGKPDREPTPRQGYEADNDLTGTPVSPPSGPEMLGALAELAGELAQTGVAAGSRLLRGALSRLSSS